MFLFRAKIIDNTIKTVSQSWQMFNVEDEEVVPHASQIFHFSS